MFSFVFVLEGSEETVLSGRLIICTYIVWIYKGNLMHLLWMHDNLWSQRHWNLNCLLSREQLLLCNCHCFPFLKNMKWLSFICFFFLLLFFVLSKCSMFLCHILSLFQLTFVLFLYMCLVTCDVTTSLFDFFLTFLILFLEMFLYRYIVLLLFYKCINFFDHCGFSIFHFAKEWLPLVIKLELELELIIILHVSPNTVCSSCITPYSNSDSVTIV